MLDICLPKDFGRSNLDNSRIDQFNREHETRKKETHVIVAKFKATTISKIYMIDDYAIFSQLIYGNQFLIIHLSLINHNINHNYFSLQLRCLDADLNGT